MHGRPVMFESSAPTENLFEIISGGLCFMQRLHLENSDGVEVSILHKCFVFPASDSSPDFGLILTRRTNKYLN